MKFCKCQSLIINANCTNKKCPEHKPDKAIATYQQTTLIYELCEELNKSPEEIEAYNIESITVKEANELINGLLGEKEEW